MSTDLKPHLAALSAHGLLSQFATASGVNRKTLQRIIAGEERKHMPVVLAAIERTLKLKRFAEHKPALEEVPAAGAQA